MLNLAMVLDDGARRHPERTAIVLGPARRTYEQIQAGANQVANALAGLGVGRGDTVALSCVNIPQFAVVYYGILKTGATVVPLSVLLKAREIAYHLADSGASAYFCFEGTDALAMGAEGAKGFAQVDDCRHLVIITADPAAPCPVEGATTLGELIADQPSTFETATTDPTDIAVILYTSGTTGKPKGAELTHANMVLNALTTLQLHGLPDEGHDTHLVTLPLFHSFGQTVQLNGGFATGSTLVLLPRFEATAALGIMQSEAISFFAGVPTMYWGLLGALDGSVDVARIEKNLRVAVSGGSSLPVEIIHEFKKRFGVEIKEGYGLSETSPVASFNPPDRPSKPGSIGTPVWGVEMRLIDPLWEEVSEPGAVGEIAIRGYNIMKGYHNQPEATSDAIRDGWFRTGDLGRVDEDGFFYVVDRSKDMIIRGGFNVYPREVEEVLMTHPAVSLAAVVGIPSESYGEEIKAYVIKKPGAEVSEDELVGWARDEMALYKYPRVVEFRESLPMTASGKILKRELAG